MYWVYNCVWEGNFNFEGFLGYMLYGKMVGIIGVGRIGMVLVCIMKGFGCWLFVFDLFGSEEFNKFGDFVDFEIFLG